MLVSATARRDAANPERCNLDVDPLTLIADDDLPIPPELPLLLSLTEEHEPSQLRANEPNVHSACS